MKRKIRGFTLVELIVILAILAVFVVGALLILNPSKQLNKTYDAQRASDLNTIATSLDIYYHDNNCYPVNIPLGQKWSSGGTTYSQKLPNDPQATANRNYVYLTDTTSSCPQWNVIFSKLSNQPDTSSCKLPPNCYPQNYDATWACQVSGTVNCNSIASASLPTSPATAIASSGDTSISTGNALSQNITICHNNGNGTYNQIQVTEDATVGGHDGHTGDIIPPYSYSCNSGTCQYPGKNWDAGGQATYNNSCVSATAPTPTQTPAPACHYTSGSYKLDDTQLFQTYAEFFFNPPNFASTWYMVDVSLSPDFPNDYTQTYSGFAPAYTPNFIAGYSLFSTDWLQQTTKYAALQSLPNLVWPQYQCGKTIYWKVWDFPGHTQSTQTFSNVVDCSTKVGAFSSTGVAPLNWYIYYPYIDGYTDAVNPAEPYNSTMDANCDGKINWKDYVILDMNTKMRAGGWAPPE